MGPGGVPVAHLVGLFLRAEGAREAAGEGEPAPLIQPASRAWRRSSYVKKLAIAQKRTFEINDIAFILGYKAMKMLVNRECDGIMLRVA